MTGRDQNNQDELVSGSKSTSDMITADIGAGAQNVIVGKDNTQIIGYTAEEVALVIAQVRGAHQPKTWDGRKPYLGLVAFQETDTDFFFGREALVDELLERVQVARFICIAGPSGSGKTSLAQAGLLAALKEGRLDGSQRWLYATLSPQDDPIEQLALGMARVFHSLEAADHLRKHGVADPISLHLLTTTYVDPQRENRLLIYVDQFEELFTRTRDETQRRAFLHLLTTAAQREDGYLIIVISLRSDFISQCAIYPQLRALISQQFQLVGAMEPEELARAIIKPTLAVGAEMEPELAAQIIRDMKGQHTALPLMQFALKDLFDAQSGRKGSTIRLTLVDYLERGGIQDALERHADATIGKLDVSQQQIARHIFSRLIEVSYGLMDTRRTANFLELVSPDVNPARVETIVDELAGPKARLLSVDVMQPRPDATPFSESRTVTLAHEKLIEAWSWLRTLANENRDVIALQNQIDEDAHTWQKHGYDSSFLYIGARLATVREQLDTRKLTISGLAHTFVTASIETDKKRQRRQRRNLQRLLAGLAAATLIFATLAGWATVSQQWAVHSEATAQAESTRAVQGEQKAINAQATADARRADADRERQLSLSRQLATQAVSAIENNHDIELGILLALEALRATSDVGLPYTVEAQYALHRALNFAPMAILPHKESIEAIFFSPDGKMLAVKSSSSVYLWDADSGEALVKLDLESENFENIIYSPDATLLAMTSKSAVHLWDAKSGHKLGILNHDSEVSRIAFSPDGAWLATVASDSVRLWDVRERSILLSLDHESDVADVVFSPDGMRLATADKWAGITRVWDARNGNELLALYHDSSVESVIFSPDGMQLATQSAYSIYLWDATNGETLAVLSYKDDQNSIFAQRGGGALAYSDRVVFDPHWRRAVTYLFGNDQYRNPYGTAPRLWDITRAEQIATLEHEAPVVDVVFSPDGMRVATVDTEGIARLWDAIDGTLMVVIRQPDPVGAVVFSPDGMRVATSSWFHDAYTRMFEAGGPGRLWDVRSGQELAVFGHESGVNSVIFSPDGKRIATASEYMVYLWNASSGTNPLALYHESRIGAVKFSPDSRLLATADYQDNTVQLWDARGGQELLAVHHEGDTVGSVDFSPDGITFATTDDWGDTVHLWDITSGQRRGGLNHQGRVAYVTFSPDGSQLATGVQSSIIRLWDVHAGKERLRFYHEGDVVGTFSFSPDGTKLATVAEYGGTAHLWDVRTGTEILDLSHGDVRAVIFSPDSKYLATVPEWENHTVQLWDVNEGTELAAFHHLVDSIKDAIFSPNGKWLAVSGSTLGTANTIIGTANIISHTTVHVWGVEGVRERIDLQSEGEVDNIIFSSDSKRLVTVGDNVRLWDVASGEEILGLSRLEDRFLDVAFSFNGSRLAIANYASTVHLWDAATGAESTTLYQAGEIENLVFSPDGALLATVDNAAGIVKLWNVNDEKPLLVLQLEEWVSRILFSPDGKMLATVAIGTIRLWNTNNGNELAALHYDGPDDEVVFSPDGRILATASPVRLWDIYSGEEIPLLKGETRAENASFSPNGKWLATTSPWSDNVRIWNITNWENTAVLK